MFYCNSCNNRDVKKNDGSNDLKLNPKSISDQLVTEAKFFTLSDTSQDVKFLISLFDLIYDVNVKETPITKVQFFFPSNEEEIAFLQNSINSSRKRDLMIDSIYSEDMALYNSRFFYGLSKVIKKYIPRKSYILIEFNAFDIIDNPVGNSYDTSYVKYKIINKINKEILVIFLPYLRDNEYGIENIYNKRKESLIEETVSHPISK